MVEIEIRLRNPQTYLYDKLCVYEAEYFALAQDVLDLDGITGPTTRIMYSERKSKIVSMGSVIVPSSWDIVSIYVFGNTATVYCTIKPQEVCGL
jgi:hypothetical protein